jgi:23S rRNA pseudouridine2605 synthase
MKMKTAKEMEKIRIQKFLSECGVCSRRTAEKEILNQKVKINGKVAEIGSQIVPSKDVVEYNGKRIVRKASSHPVYIMVNKPTGYVTTLSDEKGRKTVADLVSDVGVRVWPVGRLDMDSEGLLLMTNDGELTQLMTHPRHRVPKIYQVWLREEVTREILEKLSSEMTIDDYVIAPVECSVIRVGESGTIVQMILYEGRNRQIRKMCEQCGLTVRRLRRVAIGDLELDIGRGKWRYLNKNEVDYLKQFC